MKMAMVIVECITWRAFAKRAYLLLHLQCHLPQRYNANFTWRAFAKRAYLLLHLQCHLPQRYNANAGCFHLARF